MRQSAENDHKLRERALADPYFRKARTFHVWGQGKSHDGIEFCNEDGVFERYLFRSGDHAGFVLQNQFAWAEVRLAEVKKTVREFTGPEEVVEVQAFITIDGQEFRVTDSNAPAVMLIPSSVADPSPHRLDYTSAAMVAAARSIGALGGSRRQVKVK